MDVYFVDNAGYPKASTAGWCVQDGTNGTLRKLESLFCHVPYFLVDQLCPQFVWEGVLHDVGETGLREPMDGIQFLPVREPRFKDGFAAVYILLRCVVASAL